MRDHTVIVSCSTQRLQRQNRAVSQRRMQDSIFISFTRQHVPTAFLLVPPKFPYACPYCARPNTVSQQAISTTQALCTACLFRAKSPSRVARTHTTLQARWSQSRRTFALHSDPSVGASTLAAILRAYVRMMRHTARRSVACDVELSRAFHR